MTRNDDVAGVLAEFSDLVAISGGDPHRARAYEKAARSVAACTQDVSTLDRKELLAIPSVGAHIADKISQYVASGSIDELEDLRAQVPAGLRTLLNVPGLGPKRAHQVYAELGIASVPQLLDALHDHELRDLKGWGQKSEDNLRLAIRQLRELGERIPIAVALHLAEDLVDGLRKVGGVREACYAGSLRRMCETIGDVDLLVAADNARDVVDAFTAMAGVDHVLSAGGTRSSVVTTRGIQVDLRVVEPGSWGAALQYFTGSKAHNVKLRARAQARGYKLSEYGLFDIETGDVVASRDEQEIYERLGLGWIAPTLREDRGEIEAAEQGRLPDLIELADIRGDLHDHTDLSDGLASLDEMIAGAESHGYDYLAITDHASLMAMQRVSVDKILDQRRDLRAPRRRPR